MRIMGTIFPLLLAELYKGGISGLVAGALSLLGRLHMKDSRPCCGLRVGRNLHVLPWKKAGRMTSGQMSASWRGMAGHPEDFSVAHTCAGVSGNYGLA